MYHVFVRDLEVYAYHGVSDQEQAIGHRYSIDIEVEVDGMATESDDVADSVDYGALALLAVDAMGREQHRTVERLAQVVAEEVLLQFVTVVEVQIRIAKKLPPMAHLAAQAGVSLTLRRAITSNGRL